MKTGQRIRLIAILIVVIIPIALLSQRPTRTLVVRGFPGSIPVTEANGKAYVELKSLAKLLEGALTSQGSEITLTISSGDQVAAGARQPVANSAAENEISKDFLRAGIEAMSTIREWHSALSSAIKNQFPMTEDALASFQMQASTNLRLAQTAAATNGDQQAFQFVSNEFDKMQRLAEKYVAKRASMNYIAPDALANDPLDQSLVACGRSLGRMAAAGQFTDDFNCH